MSGQLYHLVAAELWQQAKASGREYFPQTYQQDGFIHLTGDPAYLLKVANHFYQDSPYQDWLLLVLDPDRLRAEVKYEAAAPVGSRGTMAGESVLFPHLYGTIDYDAVVREVMIERDASSGLFLSIPGITEETEDRPSGPRMLRRQIASAIRS